MAKKNKTDNFIKAVEKRSEEERKILLDKIETAKAEAYKKAEVECKIKAEKYISKKINEAKTSIKSEYSVKNQQAQGKLFETRQNIVSDIFVKVEAKLEAYAQTEEYKSKLMLYAKEIADTFTNNDCVIYLKEADLKFSDEILKLFNSNVKIESDNKILLGGIKGYCNKLKMIADNTIDTKLENAKSQFIENSHLKIV